MYLAETKIVKIFQNINCTSSIGSKMCISYVNRNSLGHAKKSTSDVLKMWKWSCDDIAEFVKPILDRCWSLKSVVQVGKGGRDSVYPYGAGYGVVDEDDVIFAERTNRGGGTFYAIFEKENAAK